MGALVIGGSGMIGSDTAKIMTSKGYDVAVTYVGHKPFITNRAHKLDIRDRVAVEEILMKERPQWIVHTAAPISMDRCETNKDEAFGVNVDGTNNLVKYAKILNSGIVYISSSFVFDGTKGIYSEDDLLKPVNYYGETKIAAEMIIRESGLEHIIVRPDQIYTWHPTRENFVTSCLKKFNNNQKINVFVDWYNHPTYSPDLAEIIVSMIEGNIRGTYNASGETYLNRLEWAEMIANMFSKDRTLIITKNSSEVSLPAKRSNVKLDLSKIERELGRKPIGVLEGMLKMKSKGGQY